MGSRHMLGMLCLALHDISLLLDTADVAAAMGVEGLMGTDRVFQPHLHELRPHAGQSVSAAHIAAVLAASPIVASHAGPSICARHQLKRNHPTFSRIVSGQKRGKLSQPSIIFLIRANSLSAL